MRCAVEGRAPTIYGDGRQSRDFVYVGDVARANLLALDAERGDGLICNVATGGSVDLLELWRLVARAAGRDDLEPVMAPARAGDIRDSAAQVACAEEALGFRAEMALGEGLEHTVSWYRSSPIGAKRSALGGATLISPGDIVKSISPPSIALLKSPYV